MSRIIGSLRADPLWHFYGLRGTRQSAITSESAVIPAHSLLDRTGNQGAFAEFILEANRKVTRLVLGQTEGDAT